MNNSLRPTIATFVIGTRAQLIKMAPVIAACEHLKHESRILLTGQHKETINDLVEEFGLTSPIVHAVPEKERATITSLVRWLPSAWRGLSRAIRAMKAEGQAIDILVHGDTASTVLGAIVGKRLSCPVIHVESGLTSGRIWDPFPEELARRIVFRLADTAICPNDDAREVLRNRRCDILVTNGNTILDAVEMAVDRDSSEVLPGLVVASLHRFQNIYRSHRLTQLVHLLLDLADSFSVKLVLHPATRKRLDQTTLLERLQAHPGIELLPRQGYRAFMRLASRAECVLTDGGSNQEELAALGVPTILMRERTERSDGLSSSAVLEADVAGGVATFLKNSGHLHLRKPRQAAPTPSPSAQIAEFLSDPSRHR